jgi:signal transduction histidine kinase
MAESTSSSPSEEQDAGAGAGNLANGRVADLIEQLKQRSAELEEANRELRRVSHYRSLFLARMSHELRTPLTSILGFTEILLDQEKLTDAQRRFCQKIQDSGMQLQSSLNQLVDLSRLEAGQSELFFQEFPLREMLRDSCAAVARSAQKQQVNVVYDLAPQITTIVSDQGKLRQILYSFLAWSISRSREGNTVKIYADFNSSSKLRLQITDDGEPVSSLSRVFDPESIGSEEPDVTDLGIIIGRRLIDLLNGSVSMQCCEGGGMETILEIPAGPAKG